MARTINEIYDALAYEKSEQAALAVYLPDLDTAQALLTDLDTPSRVGRWRLMLWVVAVAIWAHEKLWDLFLVEVQRIADASHIGTLPWYVDKAKAFQYGFALVIQDNVPRYATDEPAARIVSRAAGRENGSIVLLKVAKQAGGVVGPLAPAELTAFEAYVDAVKMAGTVVNIISADPDLLKVLMVVQYDPLVLTPTGELILDPSIRPVDLAVEAFLANLPFSGTMVLNSLVDAAQAAAGVVNPVLGTVESKYGLFPYAPVVDRYVSYAGHMKIDPVFPLTMTITYQAYVV